MPPTFTAWRTSAASNQPQRRRRPVTVPNSVPAVAEQLAGRVVSARWGTGRSRRAWSRPWRCPARNRPRAGPCPSPAAAVAATVLLRSRTGRCRDRRPASPPARPRTGCACPRAAPHPAAPTPARRTAECCGASSSSRSSNACLRERSARPARRSSVLWCSSSSSSFGRQRLRFGQVGRPGWRAAPPCPHRPGRCRARWCRSCRSPRAASRARSSAGCSGRISAALSAMRSVSGVTLQALRPHARRSRPAAPRDRPPRRCR